MKQIQHKASLLVIALVVVVLASVDAQNIGIGTTTPKTKVHIVAGAQGNMAFPYETLVVERSEDSKLGVYNTSTNPVNFRAASIALGFTNFLNSKGNYQSFEMQFGNWTAPGDILRFNALGRGADGTYTLSDAYTNILCLDTKGNVGINLTGGAALPPIAPSANLHVNGTVRFENLPHASSGGNVLLIDGSGNLVISSTSFSGRSVLESSSPSVSSQSEIELLKQEIALLKEKVARLETKVQKN